MIEKDGFNFLFDETACSRCDAQCCSGESGNIFFTKDEMVKIAQLLNISTSQFLSDYCRKDGYRYSIKEIKSGGQYRCIFLTDNMCEIYGVRPQQCRTFPFWSYFKQDENFEELQKECIGVVRSLKKFNPKDSVEC
jgi:Fe-S-cluster containining protein